MAKRTAWEVKETKDRGGGATAHHSSQGTKTREKKGKESKGAAVQKGGFSRAFIVLSVVNIMLCNRAWGSFVKSLSAAQL